MLNIIPVQRWWRVQILEIKCVVITLLHVRFANSGIQAGCFEWCLWFDWHQCCKHHKKERLSVSLNKEISSLCHFPITLSESLWCWFRHYPSSSVDLGDVKNLLSDRILTLFMAKLTICWGMCSPSTLEEMSSFLLYFILPLSLGLYMPYGCFTFPLHSILFSYFFIYVYVWPNQINEMLLDDFDNFFF